MDKEKQIQTEELIGIIQGAVGGCATYWASLISEEVLKYYQPKIDENAVVLTKEELQAHDKGLVDKFAEMLKERAHWFLNNEIQKDHFCECLDEICKEITGEK